MKNFKARVIEIVQSIPLGRVTNYGTVAVLAGVPRGARLVGGVLHFANHNLENGESLSWQRVVNRHGYISTKCLEHPKELQKALLEEEGVEVSRDFVVDLDKYGWFGDGR